MRFDPGNQIGAGGNTATQGEPGQLTGDFQIRRGDEHNAELSGFLHF